MCKEGAFKELNLRKNGFWNGKIHIYIFYTFPQQIQLNFKNKTQPHQKLIWIRAGVGCTMLCSSYKTKHKFSKVIIFPKKCPKSYICTWFGDLQQKKLPNLKIFLRIFLKKQISDSILNWVKFSQYTRLNLNLSFRFTSIIY